MTHYKAGNTVHLGKASKWSGRFVAECNGRTQRGTVTDEPVTCKRCEKL
jgi:hypothetical protein